MLRRRSHGSSFPREDAGFTLVEMMVGMLVLTLMLVLASKGFLQSFQSAAKAQNRSEATVRVQNALEVVSRNVRIADPVLASDPLVAPQKKLSVQTVKNGVCAQRWWVLEPVAAGVPTTTITQTITSYSTSDCSGTASSTTSAVLLRDVPTTLSPFTYRDATGAAFDPTAAATPVTSAASIEIHFVQNTTGGQPVDVRTVAQIRNKS